MLVATLTVAGTGLVACDDDDSSSASQGSSDSSWAGAVSGLCTAAEQVRSGDVDTAEATFFDEAHDDLHDLGAEAADRDRAAAADLLRAKETVESDFASSSTMLADDLDALVTATRAAARATGDPVPRECDS